MLACIIVIVVLLLILLCPVGLDAAYQANALDLKLMVGPFRKTFSPHIFLKKKKDGKTQEPEEKDAQKRKKKRKHRYTLDDIRTMAEIALDALHRFRIHLSADRFRLLWIAADSDPYEAVLQYGRINALLGVLMAKMHNAITIRNEDIRCELDLTAERPTVELRLILSIQVW